MQCNSIDAKWIWYDNQSFDLVNVYMQARRTFVLDKVPQEVCFNVTADARYRLYINGTHVNRGPARGYQESWPFDSLDIAPYLRKGRNVIAVLVHNYGLGTYQYIHRNYAGLLAWGAIGNLDLSTGPEWRVRKAPAYRRHTARLALTMGFQEHFDARQDDGSWIAARFNDSDWHVPLCRHFGCMPWHALEKRGIPLLRETIMTPTTVVSQTTGRCAQGYSDTENVVSLFLKEKKRWKDHALTLTRTRAWTSLQVKPSGRERYTALCLDFGREVTGSLEFQVQNATGNEIVDYLICERIDDRKEPIFQDSGLGCRMAFGNRLFLRKGKTAHEQFEYWGFRYLVLIIRNATRSLNMKIRLHWTRYPLDQQAEFRSSNHMLNRIYEISTWTQQCCMFDAYVDCPWREQGQWWGDARVQAVNTFYLSADSRLLKRGIRQIGTQETPNGLSYGHAPTIAHNCVLPDFTLTWLITHWDYYWQTEDLSLFRDMQNRIHRALDYFDSMRGENGLIRFDDRYWLFLDQSPIFKEAYPGLYNLMYLLALRSIIALFRLTDDRKNTTRYRKREKKLTIAIKRLLINRKTGNLYGGIDEAGQAVKQDAPHIYSLAILLNLFPEHHNTFFENHLLPLVRGNRDHPLLPSPFFMFYIFEALKKGGHYADTVDCIERWWGDMIRKGLSSTEEAWDGKPGHYSMCHAWSAHPLVHLSNILLGIWQNKPAWKEIRFKPDFTHADRAEGKIATPHGTIKSAWEKKKTEVVLTLHLPKGISASIDLPGIKTNRVQGNQTFTIDLTREKEQ